MLKLAATKPLPDGMRSNINWQCGRHCAVTAKYVATILFSTKHLCFGSLFVLAKDADLTLVHKTPLRFNAGRCALFADDGPADRVIAVNSDAAFIDITNDGCVVTPAASCAKLEARWNKYRLEEFSSLRGNDHAIMKDGRLVAVVQSCIDFWCMVEGYVFAFSERSPVPEVWDLSGTRMRIVTDPDIDQLFDVSGDDFYGDLRIRSVQPYSTGGPGCFLLCVRACGDAYLQSPSRLIGMRIAEVAAGTVAVGVVWTFLLPEKDAVLASCGEDGSVCTVGKDAISWYVPTSALVPAVRPKWVHVAHGPITITATAGAAFDAPGDATCMLTASHFVIAAAGQALRVLSRTHPEAPFKDIALPPSCHRVELAVAVGDVLSLDVIETSGDVRTALLDVATGTWVWQLYSGTSEMNPRAVFMPALGGMITVGEDGKIIGTDSSLLQAFKVSDDEYVCACAALDPDTLVVAIVSAGTTRVLFAKPGFQIVGVIEDTGVPGPVKLSAGPGGILVHGAPGAVRLWNVQK